MGRLGSVVFTFLVTLTVVVAAVAAALAFAISDPEQPATLREHPWRDRRRAQRLERAARRPPRRPPTRPSMPRPTRGARPSPPLVPGRTAARTSAGASASSPVATPTTSPSDVAEWSAGASAEQWVPAGRLSAWVRLRSGVVLTLLLALVGALVAAGISGLLLLIALAVRDAVS